MNAVLAHAFTGHPGVQAEAVEPGDPGVIE